MKILVIRLSSLGDVVLSTFVVRLLQNAFPESQIDFLVAKDFAFVFKHNPRINRIIEYDKSKPFYLHLLQTLSINNPAHYDVILDLQNNPRSWVYSWGKGTSIFRFNKRRLFKFKLVYLKKRTNEFLPIPILYAQTLPKLQDYDDGLGLEIWTTKDREFYLPHTKEIKNISFEKIGIAPGAKHFTKRLPTDKFVDLIRVLQNKYNSKVYLLGGKDDIQICEEIANRIGSVTNFAGKFDIIETAELIDELGLVISNDSAVVHIAAARKVPVIQIFGSTVPEFGFIPFRVPFAIVENNSVNCRPCTHFGRPRCPKKHFRCMVDLSLENILASMVGLKS